MAGITSLNTTANQIRGVHNRKTEEAQQAAARVASGNRINKPSVDASSLAISQSIRAKIGVLEQSARNVGQGAAVLNIAIGGMNNIQETIVKMKALATKANNDLNDPQAFAATNAEYQNLLNQINTIADTTRSGNSSLLKGGALTGTIASAPSTIDADSLVLGSDLGLTSASTVSISYAVGDADASTPGEFTLSVTTGSTTTTYTSGDVTASAGQAITFTDSDGDAIDFTFSTGSTFDFEAAVATFTVGLAQDTNNQISLQVAEKATDMLNITIEGVDVEALSLTNTNVSSRANAVLASTALNNALNKIQSNSSSLGAQQLQFESTASNIATSIENNELTRSAYSDADIGEELTKLTNNKVFASLSAKMMNQMCELQSQLARELS